MTFTNRHGQNIGDNLQDADCSAVNEDKDSVVEYPTNTPGVASDSEISELTKVDLDFAIEPTGVEMQSIKPKAMISHKSKTRLMALDNKIQESILTFQLLNQLLSQKCPVAQHKLYCPRRNGSMQR